jgi:hypothetical protein
MTNILHRVFPPSPERPIVPPGMYHSMQAEPPGAPRRLHLRVEPDGRGLLIVNASTVLHLNETATAHAWLLVQGNREEAAAEWISRRFRISRGRAFKDGRLVRDQIESLAASDDLDPVVVMGLERTEPFGERPTAPYRLDLALTYRLADGVAMDPQARRRVDHELKTETWIEVLDQAWSIGIPHVIFVGGEPTVRPDLLDLIRHAEQVGQVSGVVTSGESLLAARRLEGLAAAGLDHLLVVVDPKIARSLDGLRQAVASDVFCAAHWTLGPEDVQSLVAHLRNVRETGVTHISLSAPPGASGAAALAVAQQALAEAGLSLVWDLPVPFSSHNPIRLEAGVSPEAGAWLYIEPDGDVLPAIGADTVLGNVVRDPIVDMWRRAGEGLALPAV